MTLIMLRFSESIPNNAKIRIVASITSSKLISHMTSVQLSATIGAKIVLDLYLKIALAVIPLNLGS